MNLTNFSSTLYKWTSLANIGLLAFHKTSILPKWANYALLATTALYILNSTASDA